MCESKLSTHHAQVFARAASSTDANQTQALPERNPVYSLVHLNIAKRQLLAQCEGSTEKKKKLTNSVEKRDVFTKNVKLQLNKLNSVK